MNADEAAKAVNALVSGWSSRVVLPAVRSRPVLVEPIPAGMGTARPGLRRLTRTVALGGGGLTLLGVTGVGVLVAEARMAKRWIEPRMPAAHALDGRYDLAGRVPDDGLFEDDPVLVGVLGDSAAAGVGADSPAGTPGVLLATGVAAALGRQVELTVSTRSGAVSAELEGQTDRLLERVARPDVVLVIVGGNDVQRRVPAGQAAALLRATVARLVALGTHVVVGTTPDLGTITQVAQPLRALGGRWSRQLATAQAAAVLNAGGHPVDLRAVLADDLRADPSVLFSEDRFHPSAEGYRRVMAHVVPVAVGALTVTLHPVVTGG
ncbi:SGNH/GDSL hydrolase family protein [Aquipuribacter nitratireducens]|uniref:SGNH/GDSL hydrolase family protein n=1 Tax=Aquipuribacter nitratireducens TaxID=650104 RepID=A0ABW0GK96_9MICO